MPGARSFWSIGIVISTGHGLESGINSQRIAAERCETTAFSPPSNLAAKRLCFQLSEEPPLLGKATEET